MTSKTPAELTHQLLDLASIDTAAVADVAFTGPDTVLPSSFRVTEAAQSLVAAVSVAVTEVAALRTPALARPAITVDSVEASAAFQSERHLQVDRSGGLWDGLSGYYRVEDGYVQFHTNFPHHRDALLAVAGCSPDADRAAVEAAVAGRGRFELETETGRAGGIAAALREADEWALHPHAAHVEGRPPLTITEGNRDGDHVDSGHDSGHLSVCDPDRPLAGIRVLDLTRVIAGPVCARTLAAYGADVLRIGADGLPVVDGILADTTLGKRFADCDITNPAGRERLLALVADADVVVAGFRPGALAGYGVGLHDLLEAKPDLVVAQLSAFGPDGPWGGKRGFDSITQTATGIVDAETTAYRARSPRPLPCQLLDHGSGFLLALGVLSGLIRRHKTGRGSVADASLLTTRNWLDSLGRADPEAGEPLDETTLEPFLADRTSPFGPIRHVRHPGRIEGMPSRWDRGPSKPGADTASWL